MRTPKNASHAMVATSEPHAAKAGRQMFEKGGNAVDAAIATAIALTVTENTSNGIGADAFAIVSVGGKNSGFLPREKVLRLCRLRPLANPVKSLASASNRSRCLGR